MQKHRGTLHIEGTPIKRTGTFYVTDEAQAEIYELVEVIGILHARSDVNRHNIAQEILNRYKETEA